MSALKRIISLIMAVTILSGYANAEVFATAPEAVTENEVVEEVVDNVPVDEEESNPDEIIGEEETPEIIETEEETEATGDEITAEVPAEPDEVETELPDLSATDEEIEEDFEAELMWFYFTGVYKVTSGVARIRTGPSSKYDTHHTLASGKQLDIIEIKKTDTGHYWGKTRQGRWTCVDNDNIERVSGIKKDGGKYEFKSGAVRRKGPADSYAGGCAVAGDVVKISQIHYNDYGNKWGLIDGGGTYKYVWMSNVTAHSCSYSAVKTSVEYKSKNENKHIKYTYKTASKCKCGKVKSKADTDEKTYDHSYNLGKCTVCGHKFKLQYKDMGNKYYETKNDSVPVRSVPFAEQSAYKYYDAGKVLKIKRSTTSDRGSKWLETSDGDWIYDGNLKKHDHDYENGICTNKTCKHKKSINIHGMDTTKYEITKDSVVVRERPYGEESPVVDTLTGKGKIVKIKGYCWNQYLNKWYQTTDGYWVFEDNVKKHSDHNYSAGKCTNSGCGAEFKLDEKKVGKQYEITKNNVALRKQPYSNVGGSRTMNTGEVISIDTKAKNSAKNWWYKTKDKGDWVFEDNIKVHKHNYVNGVCKNKGCGDLFELDVETLSKTKTLYTNKLSVVARKSPYQNGEILHTYENFGTGIKVDAKVKNAAGNIWYRVKDKKWWIFEDNLSTHEHTYDSDSVGKCSKAFCGYEWPYKVITMTPTSYYVKSDEAPMWKRPYAESGKKDTKVKGDVLTIVAKTTNCYNNVWYKDSRGIWISGGHIKVKTDVVPIENPTPGKVSKDKYLFDIDDSKGKAISGATIWLGDIDYITNKDGQVYVPVAAGKYSLTIVAAGYETYTESDFSMGSIRKKTIKLGKADKCEITKAELHYNNQVIDVLHTTQKINKYNNNVTFSIICKASGKNAAIYRLCQGDKEMVSCADGKFTNLKPASFDKDKTVVLKVYDISKNLLASKKLMLDIIYSEGDFPGEISFGSAIKVTIPDTAPMPLGGSTITIPLLKTAVDFKMDGDGNIRVGVGFPVLDSTEKGKPGWKQIKSMNAEKFKKFATASKLATKPSQPFEFSTSIGGYIEGNFNGKLLGKLFITASVDAYKEFQIPGPPIPLVFEITFEGEMTVDGTIEWTKVSGFECSMGLEVKVELGAYLGIGAAGLFSVGGYGKGQFGIELKLSSATGGSMAGIWVDAVYGVKIKLCGKNVWSKQLGNAGKTYIIKNGVTLAEVPPNYTLFDCAYELDEYTTMDRSYLEKRSGWYPEDEFILSEEVTGEDTDTEPGTIATDYDFQALQLNSYTDIRPQVVSLTNLSMMVYADDDAERDINNRTKLVYSIYDDAVGRWSEPKAVWDDLTADYIFDVMSDGESIFVVWQNANKIFDGTEEIVDITKATDLYIAKYDEDSDAFVNVERVTNNDKYEIFPSVSSGNEKIIVSWMENANDNPFGREGKNTIKYSYKDASEYPESDLIEETDANDIVATEPGDLTTEDEDVLYPDYEVEGEESYAVWENTPWEITEYPLEEQYISSITAGNLYEGDYIAYTVDNDGDYMTHDDSEIRLLDLSDNTATMLTDRATNADFVPIHGDNTLTWYNEGLIYYLVHPDYPAQIICDETAIPADEYHIITDDNGDMAILYSIATDTGSEAYMLKYEDINFEWGLPIKITEQDAYIKNFNGAYKNGKIIGVFNQISIDDELNETNNLCTVTIGERHDIAILKVDYDETSILAGENDIEVTVQNNGNTRVSDISVKIYDEHEELIKEETVAVNLRVGDKTTFETQIVMPEEIEMTTFKVLVEEVEMLDQKTSDNFEFFTIGLPMLSLELSSYTNNEETIITADITNTGYDVAGGSIALFDEDDSIYAIVCDNIEPLSNGDMYSYSFVLDPEFFGGNMYKTVTVGVICDTEQYTDSYNKDTLYLRNPKEYENATLDILTSDAEADDEIELMEFSDGEFESVIKNTTDEDIENAQLLVIAYDERGIFVDIVYLEDIELALGETHNFSFNFDEDIISSVKIVLIDKATFKPLMEATVLSEEEEADEIVVDPTIPIEEIEY